MKLTVALRSFTHYNGNEPPPLIDSFGQRCTSLFVIAPIRSRMEDIIGQR